MRKEVRWFSELMEKKLGDNEWKGGWKDLNNPHLLKMMLDEWHELLNAVTSDDKDSIVEEAVDIANFCMMIADNNRS